MTRIGASLLGLVVMPFGMVGGTLAQTPQRQSIYTCIDASGKKVVAQSPIVGCKGEQRDMRPDGSTRGVVPATLTPDEIAQQEACERAARVALSERQDANRRDRLMLTRYPNEAAHGKARNVALDDVRKATRVSEERVAELKTSRRPLMDEAEFYVGKPLPLRLKTQIDANDASIAALQALMQNQQVEAVRIDKQYDDQLVRLRKLWAGAPPGTLDVIEIPDCNKRR